MEIRAATGDDIDALKSLYWELDADAARRQPTHFRQAERPDASFLDVIANPASDFLLAVAEGEVIGFAYVQERESPAISCLVSCRYGYIQDLIVSAACRRRGYGTALFAACEAWGRERDAEYLRLSVFPNNQEAIAFYAAQGLQPVMLSMERAL